MQGSVQRLGCSESSLTSCGAGIFQISRNGILRAAPRVCFWVLASGFAAHLACSNRHRALAAAKLYFHPDPASVGL